MVDYRVGGQPRFTSHQDLLAWAAETPPHPKVTSEDVAAVDVRKFGATGDGTTNDTKAIQRAINAALAGEFGVLFFPPGNYKHDGVKIEVAGDSRAQIEMRGAGRRLSTLQARSDSVDGLTVSSPAGNVRDIVVSDLTFASGARSVFGSKMSYALFRNCCFSFAHSMAVDLEEGNFNEFANCWWVHNSGDSFKVRTGHAAINGGLIGEDSGHIYAQGVLLCNGIVTTASASKIDKPDGPANMGRCLFYVAGSLAVFGSVLRSNFNLVNMNYADSVTLVGNYISTTETVLALRQNQTGGHAVVTGNRIAMPDGAKFYERTSTGDLKNSVIADNTLEMVGPEFGTTFDDRLLDPSMNNQVHGNTIRFGETP